MNTAATHATENEVTILARILGNERGQLPRDLARYILDLGFSERDKARMHDLAVRNQNEDVYRLFQNPKRCLTETTSCNSIGPVVTSVIATFRLFVRVQQFGHNVSVKLCYKLGLDFINHCACSCFTQSGHDL